MSEKQKTIKNECSISGKGLHTGNDVSITLKPADANEGISFIRIDLEDRPVIKAEVPNVMPEDVLPRCTTIGIGDVLIHTVEHLMSALCGLGVDNLVVEIDNNELPGLDGSAIEFVDLIQSVGVIEQDADKQYFTVFEPVGVQHKDCSIFIFPHDDLKISYTLDYDHPFLNSQCFSTVFTEESFIKEIAPSRTFCLEGEAKELQASGLGKGADYTNTLVVGDEGVIDNELRFDNEFARHKVLDFIGDLYLLGRPLKGYVFAIRSGHWMNQSLLKKIYQQKLKSEIKGEIFNRDWVNKQELSSGEIMKILPHRYPFLFVDRIIELEKGKRAIGVKNVTINDNYFEGHFPTKPVMPGVLMVEALAQTAGVAVLTNEAHRGKVALFMSANNVKFRKIVSPGDQLVLHTEVVSDKTKIAKIRAEAKIGDDIVCEADLVFSYLDQNFLYE